jgi:uncharacterized protein YbjQ (UPF0145 family)
MMSNDNSQTKQQTYRDMMLTNLETVPNHKILNHFGMVSGSVVRAKHIGTDFLAGLKNIVGGELGGYTKLMEESRAQAVDRMVQQSRHLGANAITNIRFATSSITAGAVDLYVYGTALRVEKTVTPSSYS